MQQRARGQEFERVVTVCATPWGWAGISVSSGGVCRIILPRKRKRQVERELARPGSGAQCTDRAGSRASAHLRKAAGLLERYFSGKPAVFDLPLDLRYYTLFQRAVWRAASKIPRGETRSYGWIAKQIGRPKAARAVGQAMGANPVPVLIP